MKSSAPPFLDSRDFGRIARAIRYIDDHFHEQPRLAAIAADAGLSVFHFNRLFRRWAGITPKQYLAYVTGGAAKTALQTHPSVLDAAYSVGLSGPGRLHDLIVTLEAMTPGELKLQGSGALISYGFSNTPFGRALLASTARGVFHLAFVESGEERAALLELTGRSPEAELDHDDAGAARLAGRIWFDPGKRGIPRLALHVGGTNFQLKVWQALLRLGAARTTTYTQVAKAVGQPTATRAVANAVAANPVAWLIPCHNVLRKDGALGGYHWGPERKRAMLAWRSIPPLVQNAT